MTLKVGAVTIHRGSMGGVNDLMTSWFTQDVGQLNPEHPPDYSPSALETADSSLSDKLSGRKGKVVDREGSGTNPGQWRNESSHPKGCNRQEPKLRRSRQKVWDRPGSNKELSEISREEPFVNSRQIVIYLEDLTRRRKIREGDGAEHSCERLEMSIHCSEIGYKFTYRICGKRDAPKAPHIICPGLPHERALTVMCLLTRKVGLTAGKTQQSKKGKHLCKQTQSRKETHRVGTLCVTARPDVS